MRAGTGVLPVPATGASAVAKRRSRQQLALVLGNRRGAQVALIATVAACAVLASLGVKARGVGFGIEMAVAVVAARQPTCSSWMVPTLIARMDRASSFAG